MRGTSAPAPDPEDRPLRSRPRLIALRALAGLASLVLTLGLVEVGLRLAGVAAPVDIMPLRVAGAADPSLGFSRWDPDLIWSLVPGSRAIPTYAIDRHGYRSPDFDDARPEDTLRVVVTGDSTTFGMGVLEDEAWPAVLRAALDALLGDVTGVELIDAGVPGYSTLNNRNQIERDLLALQPHLIVECVTGFNDCHVTRGESDAELVARYRGLGHRLGRLHIVQLLAGSSPFDLGRAMNGLPGEAPKLRVGLDELQRNLRQAVASCAAARVPLMLVAMPTSVNQRRKEPDIARVGDIVAQVAGATGAPLADVRPAWAALGSHPLYVDGVHPTPLGHQLVARAVLTAMLRGERLPELPDARRRWLDAWLDAGAHGLSEESLAALVAAGAPPLFEQLLELYRSAPGLEARIEAADPALPAAVRDSDPIAGRRTARRSTARLLAQAHAARSAGEDARAASLEDEARALDEHLAPGDPLLALLGGAWPAAPELERTARALLAFDAAIGLPRERVDLRLGRAFDPAAPTDLGAARALLTDVLVLEPDDVEARLQLALLLRRAGEADAARAELEELVRRAPDRVEGHYALGILRFLSKDWAGAEAPLLEAVRVRPALGEAHYLLGLASRQLGKLEQAARHLAVAQVVLGRSPETEQLLAAIQAELAARDAAR